VSKMSPSPEVEINLIVLTSGDFGNPNVVLGDYLVPFQALLSTHAARGEIAVRQAERAFATKSSTESRRFLASSSLVEWRSFVFIQW
jgi:hypothetical protein